MLSSSSLAVGARTFMLKRSWLLSSLNRNVRSRTQVQREEGLKQTGSSQSGKPQRLLKQDVTVEGHDPGPIAASHDVTQRLQRDDQGQSYKATSKRRTSGGKTVGGRSATNAEKSTRSSQSLKKLYQSQGRWPSEAEFVQELADSVLFYDPDTDPHGLVVINKPNGLPLKRCDDSKFSLMDGLPFLASVLGVPKLYYIKAPERYHSGVTLLSTSEETVEHVNRCRRRCYSVGFVSETNLVLTNALPRMNSTKETIDMVSRRIDRQTPVFGPYHVEPIISRQLCSMSALRKGKEQTKRIFVSLDILARSASGPASLTALQSTSTYHNFVACYMADMLSPLLGDKFYSYRARSAMGVMTRVSHTMSPPNFIQSLPPWMLKALGLSESETHFLPKHVHLARVYLPGYFHKGHDLTIVSHPPDFFVKTARAIGLQGYALEDILDNLPAIAKWRKSTLDKEQELKQKREDEEKLMDIQKTHVGRITGKVIKRF